MSSPAITVTLTGEKFTTKSSDKHDDIMETFILDGEYAIESEYENRAAVEADVDFEETEHCKAVYYCGNILYKTNEPKIWEYIDLIIEATHNKTLSISVDRSVRNRIQKMSGTICPTRDTIFAYDGKLFVLIGRYIYGYDQPYVRFEKVRTESDWIDEMNPEDDDEEYESFDETEVELPASLDIGEIVLPTVSYSQKHKLDKYLYDQNYSFAIIDASTQVLLAFALYR